MISPGQVYDVVTTGEIIEDYPEDLRGHSCLMSGFGEGGRAVHVVCSPKDDYLAIITAYLPEPTEDTTSTGTRFPRGSACNVANRTLSSGK